MVPSLPCRRPVLLLLTAGLLASCASAVPTTVEVDAGSSGPPEMSDSVSQPTVTPPPAPEAGLPATDHEPDAPADEATISRDELQELADLMSRALDLDSQRDGWTQYFDQELNAGGDISGWWDSVQSVPMDVREIRFDRKVSDLEDGAAEVSLNFRHQITGADANAVIQPYSAVIQRRGSGLSVREWGPVQEQPWDWAGDLTVRHNDQVMLLVHEDWEWLADDLLEPAGHSVQVTSELAPDQEGLLVIGVADAADMADGETMVYLDGAASGESRYWGSDGDIAVRAHLHAGDLLDELDYLGDGGPLPSFSWYAVQSMVEKQNQLAYGVPWAARGLATQYYDEAWNSVLDPEILMDYYLETAGDLPDSLPPNGNLGYFEVREDTWVYDLEGQLVLAYLETEWGAEHARTVMWTLATTEPVRRQLDVVVTEQLQLSWEKFEEGFVAWSADLAQRR